MPVASAASTTSSMLYVSAVNMDPAVLYPYEQGTISVTVANSGNQSVGLSNANLISDTVLIDKKDSWNTMSYIASGSTITYSFVVSAKPPDSSHFALFSVETKEGDVFHYPVLIKVDSSDLMASISDKPEVFPLAIEKTVNLSIINPRSGMIDNIFVTASGSGIEVSPSQKYVTSLDAQSSVDVPFTVTPSQNTNLTFHISYQSGDVDHSTEVVLPIIIGNDKTAAVPVVNNVVLTTTGSYYDITGDITNTGITDAKGLTVTVGPPAHATGTYAEYAIGSLSSDDAGSFEVTFTASDLSSVPLVMIWKDAVGNDYRVTKMLNLGSVSEYGDNSSVSRPSGGSSVGASGYTGASRTGGLGGATLFSGSRNSGISSFYPVIAAGIIVVIGIVLYIKRKWVVAKFKKQ
ncbi:MAG: CARDB domain-containing protein [Methanoregula sp.]|nr:CARDB domain-containing protein [Methanoregula sp.]